MAVPRFKGRGLNDPRVDTAILSYFYVRSRGRAVAPPGIMPADAAGLHVGVLRPAFARTAVPHVVGGKHGAGRMVGRVREALRERRRIELSLIHI